jgi:hypothetical protein
MSEHYIRYYVTKNRISPFAALYCHWQRGNFAKMCRAGVLIHTRDALPEEVEAYKDIPRFLGFRYDSFLEMVREVSLYEGPEGRKAFMQSARKHRHQIEMCLKEANKKKLKHEMKKQANALRRKELKNDTR